MNYLFYKIKKENIEEEFRGKMLREFRMNALVVDSDYNEGTVAFKSMVSQIPAHSNLYITSFRDICLGITHGEFLDILNKLDRSEIRLYVDYQWAYIDILLDNYKAMGTTVLREMITEDDLEWINQVTGIHEIDSQFEELSDDEYNILEQEIAVYDFSDEGKGDSNE